ISARPPGRPAARTRLARPPACPPQGGLPMTHSRRPALLASVALLCGAGLLSAGEPGAGNGPGPGAPPALPPPAGVQALAASPAAVALRGSDDARQLVVTATLAEGRLLDLTGDAAYEVADPKVARVTSAGRVVPLANGSTTVTARFGDKA